MSISIHGLATAVSIAGMNVSSILEELISKLQSQRPENPLGEVKLLPVSSLMFYAELEALGGQGLSPEFDTGHRKFNLTVNCERLPGEESDNDYSSVTFFLIVDSSGIVTYVNW